MVYDIHYSYLNSLSIAQLLFMIHFTNISDDARFTLIKVFCAIIHTTIYVNIPRSLTIKLYKAKQDHLQVFNLEHFNCLRDYLKKLSAYFYSSVNLRGAVEIAV